MKKHENATVQTGDGISHNRKNTANIDSCNFKALNGTAETHVIPAEGLNKFDPVTFLKHRYEEIKDVIKQNIKE
jgi:translation elongation factor EF-1alpha